ncbi:MAG: FAD binding domain-containing protein, partial [Clostridia bacterium]|nr:FAD binding domain-containing protein [Clostridia bacterium]
MMNIQKYIRAQSLEEAWQLNQDKRNRVLGGMLWLRLGRGSVNTAIDLCDLGLNTIEETEEQFSIGATATLRDIETHEGLNAYTNGAIANAVKDIVGVQFRNMATVGGSIWGRFGFSDVLTVFLAMDSYVELYKGGIVSLEDFAKMKPDNDILVRLIVKKPPCKIVYSSVRNQRTDFPVLACAVALVNGQYRASIGARPSRAMLLCREKS